MQFYRWNDLTDLIQTRAWKVLHRVSSSLSGHEDPSFRALSGRLKFTVRRHKFNKDSLSSWYEIDGHYAQDAILYSHASTCFKKLLDIEAVFFDAPLSHTRCFSSRIVKVNSRTNPTIFFLY